MGFLNLLIQKFQNTQICLRTFKEENVMRKALQDAWNSLFMVKG
jgi:hypothetical protein